MRCDSARRPAGCSLGNAETFVGSVWRCWADAELARKRHANVHNADSKNLTGEMLLSALMFACLFSGIGSRGPPRWAPAYLTGGGCVRRVQKPCPGCR